MGLAAKSLLTFLKIISLIQFLFLSKLYLYINIHTVLQRVLLLPYFPSLRESLFSPELILLIFASVSLNEVLVLLVFDSSIFF